jgi:lactate dehydrogenase-like 2-hydroxyacid dehydrogenase
MIPQKAINRLQEHCDVEVNPEDRVLTRCELIEKVADRDAVLCLLTDSIDREVLEAAAGRCRIFANYAVGYNNVDVEAATENGILVSNTPGVLTDTTADLAWALLFTAARRVVEADSFTRAGNYKGWGPMMFLGQDITGATLGIIGGGRIGTAFARKAQGFDMKILYHDVEPSAEFERETGAEYVARETLLGESDFVSIHVPLLPETTHLIGREELEMMKETAVLINTSRGPVIDEKALVDALRVGEIYAAGLDVFENEPELAPGLADLRNVVVLPHIASASIETRTKMGLMAVDNIIAATNGETPPNCVNEELCVNRVLT